MNPAIPEWLYDYELDPGLGAYDALSPALRAHLKSQIAILYELCAAGARPGGGFCPLPGGGLFTREKKPLDWALFVLDANYASPAGFIAALLPALMAGVELALVCRSGPKDTNAPLHPAISAAMELLGREEIFALPPEDCAALADELLRLSPCGRVVALGGSYTGAAILPATVKIGLDGAAPDAGVLAWLHPGAVIEPVKPGKRYDAVITAGGSLAAYSATLVLGPSHAYFWQWPSLSPAFFQHQRVSLI